MRANKNILSSNMQVAAQYPPKTIMEVYRMLPEGTRAELIKGILFMSPAPTLGHQNIIFVLTGQFYNYINSENKGIVFVSPVDVYFDQKNAVQPDIVFISNQRKNILKEDGIYGAPDLVIEVLSPGTKKFDLDKKKKIYERHGVKEYWVVDPETKESLGYQLKNSKFILFKQEKGKLASALLKHTFKF
jgi:Uma2 family endonuclease